MALLRFLGACACLCAVGMASDPFAPGFHKVVQEAGKTSGGSVNWSYLAKAPAEGGKSPVFIFITGGGGLLPAYGYESLLDLLAMKGVTSMTLWREDAPAPKGDGASIPAALSYLKANVRLNTTAEIDWGNAMISGHSAGNHVWCDYLKDACTDLIKGVVMIDPVDGYDPWGIVNNFCITKDAKLNYSVPGLLLSTGLDPVPGPRGQACAPAKMSNTWFYNAWNGPVWEVNATAYGHLDACDPEIEKMGAVLCAADTQPKLPYKEQVVGLIAAFAELISGNAAAEKTLTNTAAMPVASISTFTHNNATAPYTSGCHPAAGRS